MRYLGLISLVAAPMLFLCSCTQQNSTFETELRAPSYPLVTIDPYTSAWSPADELYGATVEHWTGHRFPLLGVITVDGKEYRFLGKEKDFDYKAVAAAAREHPWDGGTYTLRLPSAQWMQPSFKCDPTWEKGQGGFGARGRSPMTATWFETDEIWVRREVTIPEDIDLDKLYLQVTHKGHAEYYVNGVKVADVDGRNEAVFHHIPAEAFAKGEKGKAVLAGHCEGENGNFIDMGLYIRRDFKERYPQTAVQTSAQVRPMNTVYAFEAGPVTINIKFTAPLFLDNLNLVSRPVNYINYAVKSSDGAKHDVSLRLEAGAEWALDYATDETAVSETYEKGHLLYARTGNISQDVLWKSGDNVRIDWGHFYLAAEKKGTSMQALPGGDLCVLRDLGSVKSAEGKFLIGYDDICSVQYFGENLRPYWNKDGNRCIEDMFEEALGDYPGLMKKSCRFDARLLADAEKAGGRKYAELCALAYRQAIHAHKLVVLPNGELGFFSKENNSNGCIGTVDVTYPSVPIFFIYNTDLVKGLINHIFDYSESGRWTKEFPAHDIGRYPLANGQFYGGDMPVEEAGNMLTLTAAICHFDGNADYARKHWETLTLWTKYLELFGLDPENQLCTDDFAGHFAHNVNLSAKAIMGIASYGYMAQMMGETALAEEYLTKARNMAAEWMQMADDGDHYRLTFDKAGTWSQKYNIIWDRLLNLGIFPQEVMHKEIKSYLCRQNTYGLPLDNRTAYTKTDWITWTATMTESMEDFQALTDPVYKFYNETTDRDPMGDWVWTDRPERVGFKARSVVGGIFMKLLDYYEK